MSHRATFNLALWASPELSRQNVTAGRPSLSLTTIFEYSLAAALRLRLSDFADNVRIKPVRATSSTSSSSSSSSRGVIHFDADIDFCVEAGFTWPAATGDSGEVHTFERRFRGQAQTFEAFRMGTIRLLELKTLFATTTEKLSTTTVDAVSSYRPVTISLKNSGLRREPSDSNESSSHGDAALFVMAVPFLLLTAVFLFVVFKLQRLKVSRTPVLMCDAPAAGQTNGDIVVIGSPVRNFDGFAADLAPVHSVHDQFICTTAAFSIEEVKVDDGFHGTILMLADGDVVEVLAGSQGWYYGQVVGDFSRAGYFPQSRVVNWLARPIEDELPPCTAIQHEDMHAIPPTPESSDDELPPHKTADAKTTVPQEEELPVVMHDTAATHLCEAMDFSPSEIEDESARNMMLGLTDGEVVEVLSSSGQWFYGRVLGAPDREGYFPSNRLRSWMHALLPDPFGNQISPPESPRSVDEHGPSHGHSQEIKAIEDYYLANRQEPCESSSGSATAVGPPETSVERRSCHAPSDADEPVMSMCDRQFGEICSEHQSIGQQSEDRRRSPDAELAQTTCNQQQATAKKVSCSTNSSDLVISDERRERKERRRIEKKEARRAAKYGKNVDNIAGNHQSADFSSRDADVSHRKEKKSRRSGNKEDFSDATVSSVNDNALLVDRSGSESTADGADRADYNELRKAGSHLR